jgi:hypothetical protein
MPHPEAAPRFVRPTRERYQHGAIDLPDLVVDREGRGALAHRAVDTLAALERNRSIKPEMRQAGEDFRALFRRAHLDPLKASDLGRTIVDCGQRREMTSRIEHARRAVMGLLAIVGPAGAAALWHVVGCECSLEEWATQYGWQGRPIHKQAAAGILIAALGTLAEHFNRRRRAA